MLKKDLYKRLFSKPILWIGVIAIGFAFYFMYVSPYPVSNPFSLDKQTPTKKVMTPTTTIGLPTDTTTPPPFPDFSQAPVQPKNTFDVSTWQQFDDPQVGLKFKYPSAWGKPHITYRKGGTSGMYYLVTFPNSSFRVGGNSADASEGRDGSPNDFKGFSTTIHEYAWIDPDTFCTNGKFVFCNVGSNKLEALYEPASYFPYLLYEYINRPGKEIGGLIFGGDFITQQYTIIGEQVDQRFNQQGTKLLNDFNNAILERKIDVKSMKTFDEYEQVFQTIELY